MSLFDKMFIKTEVSWLEEGFLDLLREYTLVLKESAEPRTIPRNTAIKFNGSLQDVLDELVIDRKYHYAVLLVNDYTSYQDFRSDTYSLLIPSTTLIDDLYNIYITE